VSNQVFTENGDVVTQGIYNALRDAHATLAERCQELQALGQAAANRADDAERSRPPSSNHRTPTAALVELREIVNNQAPQLRFLSVDMVLLRQLVDDSEPRDELSELREIIDARCINGASMSRAERLRHALNCRDAWSSRLAESAVETPAPLPQMVAQQRERIRNQLEAEHQPLDAAGFPLKTSCDVPEGT